ncbi:mannitol-1-phosphate 5-dehydrogenase [Clostridium beijerinckii]|uniref:Mannitol-1-phosphate 5-dehydrogenase n=1 Tax=Clostridium beijerinckii TaxID=1520 RepID=A0A9Q5GNY1_CLOBE|nr:mannitol-1-phosphate 5-dehydrogenase [Clostridium beijerinckii]AQS02900.1 mannitol-1-phosphate 5-dehydrogenase [Clostridium beijerinckii]MBA2886365.1 mannitol-1-phosphate 5-dehydrogenase [Clostridium beijerinckii]MBA2901099.1 mannitol-1-phosphate 5-dehydrogenase [Clostridium beijerinckii]MBA2910924.1 mannitol-1-phosphate 5-dehydrogenase [Clostridium beijerinckii]MBA9017567.1 mannitol-1-phosphate 5-dehydrogenase [Clostridium beijerinckii]
MKAIQFGAGNIGRGFIGALLSKAGYHVVFADVNKEVIDKINEDKKYTIHVMDVNCEEIVVENISGVISINDEILDEIKEAEIITTAVGLVVLPRIAPTIAKGIQLRKEAGIKTPLNIIACENAIKASSQLKAEVEKCLSEEEKAYLEEFVGFPDCSVDRIVPPVKSENILDVVVEKFYEWNVEEKAFKGSIPAIEGMNLADNLMAYIERKLFTLNTGHAITAYIGNLKGYGTIDESIADEKIYNVVKKAMTESGMGLVEKHKFDKEAHFKYIDKIIGRFKNPYLKDDVSRVGREPLRKLSDSDRLIKPLMTARGFGLSVDNLLLGVGAALHYNNQEDTQSVKLQELIKEKGVKGAIAEVANIDDNDLLEKIEKAYNDVLAI